MSGEEKFAEEQAERISCSTAELSTEDEVYLGYSDLPQRDL